MDKKEYVIPELEIVRFETEDIMTTSGVQAVSLDDLWAVESDGTKGFGSTSYNNLK